jgi:hypothetical protein
MSRLGTSTTRKPPHLAHATHMAAKAAHVTEARAPASRSQSAALDL